jgi:hypothetical protein
LLNLKAIYLCIYCLFALAVYRMFPSKRKIITKKIAIRNVNANKEFSWIALQQRNIQCVNVSISPAMGWPDIQRIFRFIKQYSIKTILTIHAYDPAWTEEHRNEAFKNWLIALLNRFELPNQVSVIQLATHAQDTNSGLHRRLLSEIAHIDQELIADVNKHKICSGNLGNSTIGTGNDLFAWLSFNNFFFKSNIPLLPKKFLDKLLWPRPLFCAIKKMLNINDNRKHFKIFIYDLSKDQKIDIFLSFLLANKIFKQSLGAVIIKDIKNLF